MIVSHSEGCPIQSPRASTISSAAVAARVLLLPCYDMAASHGIRIKTAFHDEVGIIKFLCFFFNPNRLDTLPYIVICELFLSYWQTRSRFYHLLITNHPKGASSATRMWHGERQTLLCQLHKMLQ